jgi:PAS domain S-box-containing protein
MGRNSSNSCDTVLPGISRILSGNFTPEKTVTHLLDLSISLFNGDFAVIFLAGPDQREYRVIFTSSGSPACLKGFSTEIPSLPTLELDFVLFPHNSFYPAEAKVKDSEIMAARIPLTTRSCAIMHIFGTPGRLEISRCETSNLLLRVLALVVENGILIADTQKKISKLTTLYEIARKSNSLLMPGNILASLVEITDPLLPSDRAAFYSIDNDGSSLKLHTSRGICESPETIAVSDNLPEAQVARSMKPLLYPTDDYKSCLSLPIQSGDKLLGVLTLATTKAYAYSDEDIIALRVLVAQIAEMDAMTTTLINMRSSTDTILDSINSGLVTVDTEGRLDYVNAMARKIFPDLAEESIGKPMKSLLGHNPMAQAISDTLLLDEILEDKRATIIRDGEELFFSLTTFPIRANESDMMTGVALFFKDITEEQRLRMELKRKERLSALGELATGVAHEIRNPLSGIKMVMQILQSEIAGDDPKQEHVRIVLDESDRLAKIISDLMDFARPRALDMVSCDIRKVLRDAILLLEPLARERNNWVDMQDDSNCSPMLFDPEKMKQVFLNLIKNAIEAAEPDTAVEVRVSFEKTPRELCTLTIRNRGEIIPHNVIDKIFNPFYTTKELGTGLGLPITHSIIEEHRGGIRVRSTLDEGTVFSITLPLLRSGEENEA